MTKLTSVIAAAALLAQAALSAAQGTPTPTPAPTLLPAVVVTPVAQPNLASNWVPLTQADLSIVTGNVQRPNGIAWFNNKLYTSCTGDGTVYEIDDTTGETRAYIYGIKNAQTLYVEGQNNNLTLWIPDYQANTFTKVTRSGVQTVVHGLNGPWGLSYVDDQHFLLTNLLSSTINLISRSGDNQVVLDGLASPMGIVHDDQTLYVANYGSTRRSVEWYSYQDVVNGQQTDTDAAKTHLLVSGLQNTTDLQLGSDGKLYFAYALGNRGLVGRVDPSVCEAMGGCAIDQVQIVLYSDLTVPLAGLTITPDMRMFVHTMFTPDIYWAQING